MPRSASHAVRRALTYIKMGMPQPAGLEGERFEDGRPDDLSAYERARDRILAFFAMRAVARVFLVLAVFVFVAVLFFACIIVWAVFGLFIGMDNGWNETSPECLRLAALYNQTLGPQDIPRPPNASAHRTLRSHTQLRAHC